MSGTHGVASIGWRRVWFSDESRFLLRRPDGKMRVCRRCWKRFALCCIDEFDRVGGGSVMMWAAISHTGRTDLVHVHVQGNLTAQIRDLKTARSTYYVERQNHFSS